MLQQIYVKVSANIVSYFVIIKIVQNVFQLFGERVILGGWVPIDDWRKCSWDTIKWDGVRTPVSGG